MGKIWDILDFVFFAGFVAVTFYLFFAYSRNVAIYMVIGMIIFLIIVSIFGLPLIYFRLVNFSLIKTLKAYPIARDEEIAKRMRKTPEFMREKFYQVAKVWDLTPMIVFIKRYYLYISEPVVEDIVNIAKKQSDSEENFMKSLMKAVSQKYGFQTRAEVEAVIARLREKKIL